MRFRPCYSFVRLIFIGSWYAGKNQTGISDPLKSGVTTVRGNINFSSERRTSANHTLSDRRKRMDCESIETRSPAESTLKWKHQTVAEIYNRGEKVADTNEIYFITWNSCCRIFVRYLLRNRINCDFFSYYDQLRLYLIIDLLWKVLFLNIDLLWKLLFLNIDIIFIICERWSVYGFFWSFYTVMNYGQIKWINDNCQIVYRKDTVFWSEDY